LAARCPAIGNPMTPSPRNATFAICAPSLVALHRRFD
jgi:hypothetical protein